MTIYKQTSAKYDSSSFSSVFLHDINWNINKHVFELWEIMIFGLYYFPVSLSGLTHCTIN